MLSSRIGNISATPSPPFPTGFITLQLYSFIPHSLPGCSYAVQQARCREGFPAPDVQRYLGEYRWFWLNPIASVRSIGVLNQAKPCPRGLESSSTWAASRVTERRCVPSDMSSMKRGGGNLSKELNEFAPAPSNYAPPGKGEAGEEL